MKKIVLIGLSLVYLAPVAFAQDAAKKPVAKHTLAKKPIAEKENNNEIHWITNIDELQAKMAQNPKKVYIDIYTDWCGWCKKMDATTFSNPDVVKYMNVNYYAVRLNAERRDTIRFQGKEYHYEPQYKANTFALDLLKGEMMYPTAVIMMENFQNPMPVKGYLDVKQLETVVTYYGDNMYKHQNGADYQKTYKPTWDKGVASDMTPPPGH